MHSSAGLVLNPYSIFTKCNLTNSSRGVSSAPEGLDLMFVRKNSHKMCSKLIGVAKTPSQFYFI